ncbi:MAG TPA: prepilin-type N-terminal cleavage/methylation domain-containing protein [Phycisphaerae bacterium]
MTIQISHFSNRRGIPASPASPRRAFTLLELLLALTVTATISTAVCALIVATMSSDRFLRSTNAAQSEIELAVDRISNNIREAQSGSIIVGTSTLSTLTQPDQPNNYAAGATVAYSLQTDATTGQKTLMENDHRYGNNALLHNVTTFTVTRVAGISSLYQIDLVVGSQLTEERHFKVFARK